MNRSHVATLAIALAMASTITADSAQTASPQQRPGTGAPSATAQPSVQEINDGFVQKITRQIAGHEQEPAEKVFKNVQIMKTTPAARFLLIMSRQ